MLYFLLHHREAGRFWRVISTRAVNEVRCHYIREALDKLPRLARKEMRWLFADAIVPEVQSPEE